MSRAADQAETVVRVTNARPTAGIFLLEPWGEQYEMPAGATFAVVAQGPAGDHLEITADGEAITAWAWPGATVRLFHDGLELGDAAHRPPPPATPSMPPSLAQG